MARSRKEKSETARKSEMYPNPKIGQTEVKKERRESRDTRRAAPNG